jgi:uncharacterized protein (TIGR00645 family)
MTTAPHTEDEGTSTGDINFVVAKASKVLDICRAVVFGSKWLLLPVFISLFAVQATYSWSIVQEVWHMITESASMSEKQRILAVLTALDTAMVAFLVRTIVSGSWHAFVDKDGPMQEHISSGYLKVKMSMSLIGISSVHLLQTFLEIHNVPAAEWQAKVAIHVVFVISTIGLAVVEQMHEKTEILREQSHLAAKGKH